MNHDSRSAVQNELDAGEKLVWNGMPKQGIVFKGSDVFMIPFSLLWGGFAIFWEYMAITMQSNKTEIDIIFPLFGIPFVVIGLYMIFGRFIHESKKREKTYYGITNERAIIVSGLFRKTVKSLDIKNLSDVSLSEKSDKSGTITFGQDHPMANMLGGGAFPGMGGSTTPKFEFIENVKSVYQQLRQQQKS